MVIPSPSFFDTVYAVLARAGIADAIGSEEHARIRSACESLSVAQVVGLMIWMEAYIAPDSVMGQSWKSFVAELDRYDWSQPIATTSLLTLQPRSRS